MTRKRCDGQNLIVINLFKTDGYMITANRLGSDHPSQRLPDIVVSTASRTRAPECPENCPVRVAGVLTREGRCHSLEQFVVRTVGPVIPIVSLIVRPRPFLEML
jgi:hypothetical protein